jgi:hypothetical protein
MIQKGFTVLLGVIFLTSSLGIINQQYSVEASVEDLFFGIEYYSYSFPIPTIEVHEDNVYVRVEGTDYNMVTEGKPVLPYDLHVHHYDFPTDINYVIVTEVEEYTMEIPNPLPIPLSSPVDSILHYTPSSLLPLDEEPSAQPFPEDWISYHTGGGLFNGEPTTFLPLRIYPVRYFPADNEIHYITNITIMIVRDFDIILPLPQQSVYDLLIISCCDFASTLQPLIDHKEAMGVRTRHVSLHEIYDQMYWQGRDEAEKIKYFIKEAIEQWGIKYVLLVGGLRGQSYSWYVPVRYSHVVPWDDQEYAEPQFLSDLYFADIYDSEGEFSSWDPNGNGIYAEWIGKTKESMDLYPDVYLGRLACRNQYEVNIMVNKIITYEQTQADPSWFNNVVLVAGDSYEDESGFNEGELIADKAIELMPEFTPLKVYASDDDINRQTVNTQMNKGSGFAYFCGHGSPAGWNTHYPPSGTEWTTGYDNEDMIFLRNREKLPITVVGGCHNAQFNVTFANFIKGILTHRLQYFSTTPPIGQYWYNEWVPNCWAWMLTSKLGGGGIATIANTGLGTHGENDWDNNGIADYLEILDGWLELRFLEKYGTDGQDDLGMNHGDTLSEYTHIFLGNEDKMDVKMVQQWVLLGDPSLKIGGYQ